MWFFFSVGHIRHLSKITEKVVSFFRFRIFCTTKIWPLWLSWIIFSSVTLKKFGQWPKNERKKLAVIVLAWGFGRWSNGLNQLCPTRGPIDVVVKVSCILTTCPCLDNIEFDIFDAGGYQCHYHVCYHCS